MIIKEDYINSIPNNYINIFTGLVVLLFTIVLSGFLTVKRPDIVLGNIKLIAHNQPFELLAPYTGKLMLLKHSNDSINMAQDIAYIANPTDYQTVNKLNEILEKRDFNFIYKHLCNNEFAKKFGVLNSSCMKLRTAIYEYNTFRDKSLFEENKHQIEEEITTLKEQITLQNNYLKIRTTSLAISESCFKEDSALFRNNAITQSDFYRSYRSLLTQKEQLIEAENTLLAYSKEKASKELKLQELLTENSNNINILEQEVEQFISMLQNDIEIWRKQYVISSPITGKLEIISSIEDKQIVKKDLPILRILPINKNIIGQILFTSKQAGEIQDKAAIKIYLDSYSDTQNGYLSGYISDISSSVYTVQDGQSFHSAKAYINFNEQPYFHGKFQFAHGMTGRVEIVIKKKNILMQILNIISSNT